MGGIPVNRINPEALKGEIQNITNKYKGFAIAIHQRELEKSRETQIRFFKNCK